MTWQRSTMANAPPPIHIPDRLPPASALSLVHRLTLDSPPARWLASVGRSHETYIPAEQHPTMQSWWDACDDARKLAWVMGWCEQRIEADDRHLRALARVLCAVLRTIHGGLSESDMDILCAIEAWAQTGAGWDMCKWRKYVDALDTGGAWCNLRSASHLALACAVRSIDGACVAANAHECVHFAASTLRLTRPAHDTVAEGNVAWGHDLAALADLVRHVVPVCPVVIDP